MMDTRLLTDQLAAGTVDAPFAAGMNSARVVVPLPFTQAGAVATMRGAATGYSCSTQEHAEGLEIVCFRTGSTASAATRAVSYIAWGSDFTER